MTLVDDGNGCGLEFGHTDYNTEEGRFITHSQNIKERFVNPELSVKERHRITISDTQRRNCYAISLLCKNNCKIQGFIYYNPITEALSMSFNITGYNGKRVLRLNQI